MTALHMGVLKICVVILEKGIMSYLMKDKLPRSIPEA